MKTNLVLLLLALNSLIYAQWPQWRGPNRDGFSAETNLLKTWPAEGPRLLWSTDTIGGGFSSAIIQDKIIYVTGSKDSTRFITAIDLTGKLIWQKEIGRVCSDEPTEEFSTPTMYNDKLYTLTSKGDVYCIDSRTGDLEWKINIPDKFGVYAKYVCESPLVTDDKVILTPFGKTAMVIALDYKTGKTIWKSESIKDSTAYVSPVLVQNKEKKLIVTNSRNNMLAVDLNSGKIVWKQKKSEQTFVPLPIDNNVYFPSCIMLNISSDLSSFKSQWQDTLNVYWWGGAVALSNQIFGTYQNKTGIFCLDWKTGKLQAENKEIKNANLLAADGMIYCFEDKKGRVSLLKPTENNLEIVGSFKVNLGQGAHLAHMSIANGILFVRHGDVLMAYDIKQ